eukprot:898284_1
MAKIKNNKKHVAALLTVILLVVIVAILYVICPGRVCHFAAPTPTPTSEPTYISGAINITTSAPEPTYISGATNITTSATPISTSSTPSEPISVMVTLIVIALSVIATIIAYSDHHKAQRVSKRNYDLYVAISDNVHSLYWIHDAKLSGPFNKHKICEMYRAREIHGTILVQNAKSSGEDEKDWFKVYLPPLYPHDLRNLLTKRIKNIDEATLQADKERFTKSFHHLRCALRKVKMEYSGTLIKVPTLPSKTVIESYGILEKCLRVCATIILLTLACCILIMSSLSIFIFEFWKIVHRKSMIYYNRTIQTNFDNLGRKQTIPVRRHHKVIGVLVQMFRFGCVAFSTYLSVHSVYMMGDYHEIQSWMVGFCAWSLCYQCIQFLIFFGKVQSNTKLVNLISKASWYINGIEMVESVGALRVNIFDFLMCLLPASICGFVANYILEERYLLKCKEDYVESDMCFEEEIGCCHVISSHDFDNAYYFIGGCVSNILASFTTIRICAWVMMYGFPKFKAMSSRKK